MLRYALLLVCACAWTGQVAAEPRYSFALPAQSLPQSLSQFSRITGLSVIYTDENAYDVQAPAVSGQMTAEAALQRLLGDTPLTWQRLGPGSLTVQPRRQDQAREMAKAPVMELGATAISSHAWPLADYRAPDHPAVLRGGAGRDSAQTVNVVPAQVLRDQAPRNLDDALVNVSGVTQGNTLGSTQDTLMKRGFGDNRDGSILRDGMPMVQGRNLNATAEQVEVLKGPASLLYGIQDPGGVINVVSKRPQLDAYHAVTVRGSRYAGGNNGQGAGLDSTGALGSSSLAYRLILDHEDEDYWRNYGVHRETLVAPSLAWLGEDTQLLASYEHREFVYPFDRGTAIDPVTQRPLDIPASRRLDEPFNDMRGRSDWYRLEVDQRLADPWRLHLGYSYNRETYDASQVRVTAVDSAQGTLTRSMDGTGGALSSDRFTLLTLAGELEVAGVQHDLLLGVDDEYRKIYRGELIRQRSLATFSYLNPVYGREVEGSQVSAADSNQSDTLRSNALFIQDSLHLSEQWILVAGARYQRYDQLAGKGRPFQVNTDATGQAWVPRAGLVYQPSTELSFYASYSESFKPNSTIAALSGGTVIDSAIAPEQAKAWEVGIKFEGVDGLEANLALFDLRKRNVLVANYDAATTNTTYSNAGEVRSRGLELDFSGQLSERWSLIGNYAFTDAWVARDPNYQGNRLQNVARHSGALYGVYEWGAVLGGDRLRLGTGAHSVGERAGNPQNDFDLPAYTVADAFARYDTTFQGQKLGLQLNLKNLFDRVYYTSSVNRYFVSMGDARQLSISTTLEF